MWTDLNCQFHYLTITHSVQAKANIETIVGLINGVHAPLCDWFEVSVLLPDHFVSFKCFGAKYCGDSRCEFKYSILWLALVLTVILYRNSDSRTPPMTPQHVSCTRIEILHSWQPRQVRRHTHAACFSVTSQPVHATAGNKRLVLLRRFWKKHKARLPQDHSDRGREAETCTVWVLGN